jgi:hypothetical protein
VPDSIDSISGQILDAAIEMADALEMEASRDERRLESTVSARTTAASKVQEIRRLVRLFHGLSNEG